MKKTTVVKSTPSKTYLMWCVASATVFGYDHTSLGLILWASCAAPTLVAGGVGFNFHRCRALTGSNEYKCTPAWHSASFRGYRHQKACALKSYRNPHKQKKVWAAPMATITHVAPRMHLLRWERLLVGDKHCFPSVEVP